MRTAAAVLLMALASIVLQLAESDSVMELQPVPEMPATARHLLQGSSTAGSYGPTNSFQQADSYGSYGSYGSAGGRSNTRSSRSLLAVGGYGQNTFHSYGYGRFLAEDKVLLEPSDPFLQYAQQQQQQQQQERQWEQQQAGDSLGQEADGQAAAGPGNSGSEGSRSRVFYLQQQQLSIPAGKCYCRYDPSYNTWALAEDTCKEALYTRCQSESKVPCEWLDSFYNPAPGPAHALPFEADIKAFVHQDCSPHPPCGCADMHFDGNDAVPTAVACCKSLRVACKTPFSGISCRQVESFCSDDKPLPVLAAWTRHMLQHSDCNSYQGVPFDYASLQDLQQLQAAAAVQRLTGMVLEAVQQPAAAGAAAPALLREAIINLGQSSHGGEQQQRQLHTALAVLAAAAVSAAIAAAAYALGHTQAAQRVMHAAGAHSAVAAVSQALDSRSALPAPRQAACIVVGILHPLQQTGASPREGSGDHHSCPSRAISIDALGAASGSILEPLLRRQHMCETVSCGTPVYEAS